jgi:hypothetical protein
MSTIELEVRKAEDILNKCIELGLLGKEWQMPDSAEDKVMEGVKMVQLAQQAQVAYKAAGNHDHPNMKNVTEILFLADVDGGTPSARPEIASEPEQPAEPPSDKVPIVVEGVGAEWTWAEIFIHVIDNGNTNLAFQNPDDKGVLDAERARRQTPTPGVGTTGSSFIDKPGDHDPQLHETWIDENAQAWVISDVIGNQGYEVHPPGKEDQKTTVPLGYLKTKVALESSPSPPEQSPPSSPSTPASTPSSDSGPEPSTTTAPPSPPPASPQPPPSPSGSSPTSPSQASDVPIDDDGGDPEYAAVIAKAMEDYERAKLPLPSDVEHIPEMPEDITQQNDLQARSLYSRFNACSARARFLWGLERHKRAGCEQKVKQYMRPATADARKEMGPKATLDEVKKVAAEDENVVKWQERADMHKGREIAYKDLLDIYAENVSVLSRDWTMRSNEERGKT